MNNATPRIPHAHSIVGTSFNDIFHQILELCMTAPNHEVFGLSYELQNPLDRDIQNSVRAFDPVNAEKFFQWVLAGDPDLAPLKAVTKRAEMYDREVNGRNPHYGPRILKQLEEMVHELVDRPSTRRACMLILDAEDQIFLSAKRNDHNTIEYPCCISLTYFIRDNKLYASTVMRSQNVCSTIGYDNWNFTRLQETVLTLINEHYDIPIELGSYLHYAVNAHVIDHEVMKGRDMLNANQLRQDLLHPGRKVRSA
jgi:thymidylate synthase